MTPAGVAELADARDSKSRSPCESVGSTPSSGTNLRSAFSRRLPTVAASPRRWAPIARIELRLASQPSGLPISLPDKLHFPTSRTSRQASHFPTSRHFPTSVTSRQASPSSSACQQPLYFLSALASQHDVLDRN